LDEAKKFKRSSERRMIEPGTFHGRSDSFLNP